MSVTPDTVLIRSDAGLIPVLVRVATLVIALNASFEDARPIHHTSQSVETQPTNTQNVELEGSEIRFESLAEPYEIVLESSAQTTTLNMFRAQLNDLTNLCHDWDGDGAAAPCAEALQSANTVLQLIIEAGLFPSEIDADVLGGVAILVHAVASSRTAWFVFPNRGFPHVVLHGAPGLSPRSAYLKEDAMSDVANFLGHSDDSTT